MRTKNSNLFFILTMAISISILTAYIMVANAAVPTAGTATVDGNIDEWNLSADYFAPMFLGSDNSRPVAANVYVRYDSTTDTVYVLVLAVDGVPLQNSKQQSWGNVLKPSSGGTLFTEDYKTYKGTANNDGTPPDFAWYGEDTSTQTALGYEASFILAPGTYNVGFHAEAYNTFDDNQPTSIGTSSLLGNVFLELAADTTGIGTQIKVIKYVSTDGANWNDANEAPGLEVTVGAPIYYRFKIINNGENTLNEIMLVDNIPMTFTSNPPTTLPSGETVYVYTDPVTATVGTHANIASVNGIATIDGIPYQVVYADQAIYTATLQVVPEPTFVLATLSIAAAASVFVVYKKKRP